MWVRSGESFQSVGACALLCLTALTPDSSRLGLVDSSSRERQAAISGLVRLVDAAGQTASHVSVTVTDTASGLQVAHAKTDSNGRFLLTVRAGRYLVTAAKAGFLTSSYGSIRHGLPGSPIVLAAGEEVDLKFVLEHASVIAGVVHDDRGNAIHDVVIDVSGRSRTIDGRAPISVRARTDENGAYRLTDMEPGSYTIAAVPPPPPTLPASDSGARLQWPAGLSREIVVRAGENATTDFVLQRRAVTRVFASLKPPLNVTVGDDVVALVAAVDKTAPTLTEVQALSGGRLATALHQGRYRFDIRVTGWRNDNGAEKVAALYFSSTEVEVEDLSSQTLTLPLGESAQLAGNVVGFGATASRPDLRLVPSFGRPPAMRFVDIPISAEGRFSVGGLARGRYTLEWSEPTSPWMLSQVRVQGRVQPDLTLNLNGPGEEIELIVTAASSLSGTIVGAGTEVSSHILVLVPEANLTELPDRSPAIAVTRPDNKGGFNLSRQNAGVHWLILLKDAEPAALSEGAFVYSLVRTPGATRIELVPGQAMTIDLKVR